MRGAAAGRRESETGAPHFRAELARHAAERPTRALDPLGLPRPVPGFTAADVLGLPTARGYLPLAQAADRMGLSEDAVLEAVDRGLLRAVAHGRALLVQPAIVSVRAVRL